MKTMTLTVCGFYIKHTNLKEIADLKATNCLQYTDRVGQYKQALNNMTGEITLTKGSRKATMKQNGNEFNFNIHYVSGLNLNGIGTTYPELQFGDERRCEFRLVTNPDITRKQIQEFITDF